MNSDGWSLVIAKYPILYILQTVYPVFETPYRSRLQFYRLNNCKKNRLVKRELWFPVFRAVLNTKKPKSQTATSSFKISWGTKKKLPISPKRYWQLLAKIQSLKSS